MNSHGFVPAFLNFQSELGQMKIGQKQMFFLESFM
jgi:hypothetical protein